MRQLALAALCVAIVGTARAHFVFVVPEGTGAPHALVVFSDTLGPDDKVTMDKIKTLKLKMKDAAGKVSDLTFETGPHSLKVTLPGTGSRVVYGSVGYGVLSKSAKKPYLLMYHPKTIVGALPPDGGALGDAAITEVVPKAEGGKIKFRVLARAKSLVDAEATVMLPDGSKEKVKTDKAGETPSFSAAGRYGVYVAHMENKAGEHDGKKYEEVKHYATLVVDVAGK